ncbi:MAG: hypothetical protein ACRCYY_21145 [Trueperaceae bacterium]
MATKDIKTSPDAKIERLLKKVAKQKHITKSNGKRRKPFQRISLQGDGPTTTEIIAEGRR